MESTVRIGYEKPIEIPPMVSGSLDLLSEPYCIRIPDGPFLYANTALANFIGLRSPHEIIGRAYHEISSRWCEDEDVIELWCTQDRDIVINGKPQTMLELHPHAVDSPYICRKVPFYNNDHQCIGAFYSIKFLEVFTPNDFLKGKLPGSLLLNKPDDFFTEGECEIIFFRLQGMSCKNIALILSMSKRTVEKRLANMYVKSGVDTYNDFEAVCHRLKLHRYIPKRIGAYKHIRFLKDYQQYLSQ
mgnify:CR=1 FL=1